MGYEVEGMWKATAVAQFKVISRHLIGGTEKIHNSSDSRYSVSAQRTNVPTRRIDIKSDDCVQIGAEKAWLQENLTSTKTKIPNSINFLKGYNQFLSKNRTKQNSD
jgi:hypothetical protein